MSPEKLILVVFAQLIAAGVLKVANAATTNAPTVLPEITVVGQAMPASLTSPSAANGSFRPPALARSW
jgi:hypothetical protein